MGAMRALVYDYRPARHLATMLLARLSPRAYVGPLAPVQLREIPAPELPSDDWLVLRTRLCGVCGSDTKQIFLNGSADSPMTALISFPQVLGHEVVATVERVGPGVSQRRVGERVVLNPWLSCATRGLAHCSWCERGELAQCLNFTRGVIDRGIHHGNSRHATGGFAPFLPAHESQCIPVPDDVRDEEAVLADPFSVSLHSILHSPPPANGSVLVYGCGTLGLCAIAILRALHPGVRVLAVARFAHQKRLAAKLGAHRVLAHEPVRALIESVAEDVGAEPLRPWRGLPMLLEGVDVVYDTVGKPETLEVGVRVTRPRGSISVTGVESPARFEWTPLYFKELRIVGSNAFGHETIGERRMHAMAWYFELIRSHGIDLTPILTHRFELEQYREAFRAGFDQGASGAVKMLFDYRSGSAAEE
jgi:threonine dehydrogenase-like Zn-dependent dehydrogenase